MQYHIPPYATLTRTSPNVRTSMRRSMSCARQKAGWFRSVTPSTRPWRHSASIGMRPEGASRAKRVYGSSMGTIPVSSSAVATQIALWPLIIG